MAPSPRVPGSPPPRNAPFDPASVRRAGKGNPIVKIKRGRAMTGGNVSYGINATLGGRFISGIGSIPRSQMKTSSSATYTPGRGTRVSP